jgi:hypothetical protein
VPPAIHSGPGVSHLSKGALIGIVIACVVGVAIIIFVIIEVIQRRRRRNPLEEPVKMESDLVSVPGEIGYFHPHD